MPNKEFLEKTPLYKKFNLTVQPELCNIPKPAIHMFCPVCDSEQTFSMTSDYRGGGKTFYHNARSEGEVVLAVYVCAGCSSFSRYFLIKISEDLSYVIKVGQWLSWDISMNKDLEKTLGKHTEIYKKGLICESQGYGIGAYAYYRRIVELIIDQLLDDIEDLVPEIEKAKYHAALEKTKKTRITAEKIDLVKDMLPSSLKPEGMNPLSVLHEKLSEGLHEDTDEECMQIAETVRESIVFLVQQVTASKNASKEFTERTKKLLEKKTK